MTEHQHEAWQFQESAQGGYYCAACGVPIIFPTFNPRHWPDHPRSI